MSPYVAAALILAIFIVGCGSMGHEVNDIHRWSVEPSQVDDADLALIVAQLPAAVACIRENAPAKCGIHPDDYLLGSMDQRRRSELFSDGPVVIKFESWSDDDHVSVTFVGGNAMGDSGVMSFRRRATTFTLIAVSILVFD